MCESRKSSRFPGFESCGSLLRSDVNTKSAPPPLISKHNSSFILQNFMSANWETCRRISLRWWMFFSLSLKLGFKRSSFCLWPRRDNRLSIFNSMSDREICSCSQTQVCIIQQCQPKTWKSSHTQKAYRKMNEHPHQWSSQLSPVAESIRTTDRNSRSSSNPFRRSSGLLALQATTVARFKVYVRLYNKWMRKEIIKLSKRKRFSARACALSHTIPRKLSWEYCSPFISALPLRLLQLTRFLWTFLYLRKL